MSDARDPIDAALQRRFAPPDFSRLHAHVDAAAARRAHRAVGARTRWIVALASAAAAAIVVLVSATRDDAVVVHDDAPPAVAVLDEHEIIGARLAQRYAQGPVLPQVDDGGCMQAAAPPQACTSQGAQPRVVASEALEVIGECGAPGGVGCVGEGATRLLHLRAEGTDVLVCVEPLARDPRPVLPEDAGLRVFRRELGAYVLYEITPLPEPRALAHFEL